MPNGDDPLQKFAMLRDFELERFLLCVHDRQTGFIGQELVVRTFTYTLTVLV